jgi:hypothetical protein
MQDFLSWEGISLIVKQYQPVPSEILDWQLSGTATSLHGLLQCMVE